MKGLEDVPDHQDILIGTPLGKSSERAMKHYHHSTQQAFYEQLRLFIPKDYPAPCGSIDHQIHLQEHEDHQKSKQGSKRAPKQPLPADMKPTISSTPDPDNLIDDGSTDAQVFHIYDFYKKIYIAHCRIHLEIYLPNRIQPFTPSLLHMFLLYISPS